MIATLQEKVCDVCRLLDFDTTLKPCGYCGMCDAFICQQDMNNWTRRIRAAIKHKLEPGYRGAPDYEQLAVSKEQLKQILEGEDEHSS